MAKINKMVLKNGLDMIEDMLADYKEKIDVAYCAADGALTVTLALKLSPLEDGRIEVNTAIGFIESRVKDSLVRHIDPNQMELFTEE